MGRRIFQQNQPLNRAALPIAEGGTGQKVASDALNALGGVPQAAIGVAQGILPLDSEGYVAPEFLPPASSAARVSVVGPATVPATFSSGQLTTLASYEITDFDFELMYELASTTGTITFENNVPNPVLIYKPTAYGPGGFSVNTAYVPVTHMELP